MRPVSKRFEPSRMRGNLKVIPKYVVVTEGYRTEQIYFNALGENRAVAGISALVDIVLLQRELTDSGLSHPLVMLDLLEKYMSCVKTGRYSVDLILEVVCNEICVSKNISSTDTRVNTYCSTVRDTVNGGSADCVTDMIDACRGIAEKMFGFRPVVDLPELIDYRPETDHVCVVVDRDADNRDPQTMDEFIKGCRGRGYEPYISNPCFELWLMMHFDAFDREDRRMLLQNPMVDGRRFTEAELDRIVGDIRPENSYRKTDYDPGMFMHRTGEAVERSMGLCHDPVRLKGELGTNLGELLMGMRSARGRQGRRRPIRCHNELSSTPGSDFAHFMKSASETTHVSSARVTLMSPLRIPSRPLSNRARPNVPCGPREAS